ncbi:hypothetical protein [Hymenobacter ruricola]|uniref:Uncharacterized protein n=1 Tax=Hymenobacter ruricola TaxID=2791023 RepID=A0ABS0HYM3_9BACT|nr:hypothetical protein [Hymenobacter ruricola]MBF9219795.1 hypothetical protein [Hymenobacter ruricola]
MTIAPPLPVTLTLRPAVAHYTATSRWEAYAAGDFQATTITKALRLQVHSLAEGLSVILETGPPSLRTSTDPEPLAELAQRLAALYARLELLLTPAGEVAALLNYDALRQAGEQVLAGLRATTAPDDRVTTTLLDFTERQLASPAALLHSLQFDYLYQTLFPGLCRQPLGSPRPPRRFAGFFDKTPLWFAEQVTMEPAVGTEPVGVRVHGPLDPQRTDLAAVQNHLANALQLAAAGQAGQVGPLPTPHFCYEATYGMEVGTGLPEHAELTVYARAGQLLNKEYHLTLARI